MKAQHDQNLDIFRDFFPQSSKKFFFRTEVNQTFCLYKVDPYGKVFVPCSYRSVHGITVCLMYFNPWPAARIIMAHSDTWFSSKFSFMRLHGKQ